MDSRACPSVLDTDPMTSGSCIKVRLACVHIFGRAPWSSGLTPRPMHVLQPVMELRFHWARWDKEFSIPFEVWVAFQPRSGCLCPLWPRRSPPTSVFIVLCCTEACPGHRLRTMGTSRSRERRSSDGCRPARRYAHVPQCPPEMQSPLESSTSSSCVSRFVCRHG